MRSWERQAKTLVSLLVDPEKFSLINPLLFDVPIIDIRYSKVLTLSESKLIFQEKVFQLILNWIIKTSLVNLEYLRKHIYRPVILFEF